MVEFHSRWCIRFSLGQRDAGDVKYTINYFQYQEGRRVRMHAEWLVSSNDEICAVNYNYFPVQVEGQVSQ